MIARLLIALVVLCFGSLLHAQSQTSPPEPAVEFVVLTTGRPIRVTLDVDVNGTSLSKAWDDAFQAVTRFCDANADGRLSQEEAAFLPSAFGLRQVLWGRLDLQAGSAPAFHELDANSDSFVDEAEIARWYRQASAGQITLGFGRSAGTDRLTQALMKAIDLNSDGVLEELEIRTASASFQKLDANEDELVTPNELVPNAVYPGVAGTTKLDVPGSDTPDAIKTSVILLPADTSNTFWAAEVIRRKDQDGDGALTATESGFEPSIFASLDADQSLLLSREEISGWRGLSPDASWRVGFSENESAEVLIVGAADSGSSYNWNGGLATLRMRADPGKVAGQIQSAKTQWLKDFAAADSNSDDQVSAEEASAKIPSPLKPLLNLIDQNRDRQLSKSELDAWLGLQSALANPQVLVTLLDQGPGLFELVDIDSDGALSIREFQSIEKELERRGCMVEGKLEIKKLPHQWTAVVSRGQPLTPLGRPSRIGPAWFIAMDRNGDGYVSKKEFAGPVEIFDRLDADKDGLATSTEVEIAVRENKLNH